MNQIKNLLLLIFLSLIYAEQSNPNDENRISSGELLDDYPKDFFGDFKIIKMTHKGLKDDDRKEQQFENWTVNLEKCYLNTGPVWIRVLMRLSSEFYAFIGKDEAYKVNDWNSINGDQIRNFVYTKKNLNSKDQAMKDEKFATNFLTSFQYFLFNQQTRELKLKYFDFNSNCTTIVIGKKIENSS